MVVMTALILLIGGALLAWEFVRGGATAPSGETAAQVRVDPAAVQAMLEDPRLRALVPLAPPIVLKDLGNPTPFPVPERRQ